jgi:hypothetical protein
VWIANPLDEEFLPAAGRHVGSAREDQELVAGGLGGEVTVFVEVNP